MVVSGHGEKAGGGFTCIDAPAGQPMHEPRPRGTEGTEGTVQADIDLAPIALTTAAADPAGRYARPDVTRRWLNKASRARVASPAAARALDAGRIALVRGPDQLVWAN